MFSSNQIFEISGEMSQLEAALDFALSYSDNAKIMRAEERERGCKLLYQITKDGRFCIGWGFVSVPEGWQEYPFDIEVSILAQIISLHLKKIHEAENKSKYKMGDGTTLTGFLMKHISSNSEGIITPLYGIVSFESFYNFYAK